MNKVLVVIVNWNTGGLLAKCLSALNTLPERDIISKIVVVDNASTEFSPPYEGEVGRRPGEVFLELGENLGFSKANNLAITKHWNKQDHILLLNPDTEIHPGCLTALLEVLNKHTDVGIVGPKLLNPDGSIQGSVRPFPRFADFILYMLKLGRTVQGRQEVNFDHTKANYVDQVMGAAFLMRSQTLAAIGLLDENFFTLFEEVDYCLRARQAGWKTFFTPAGEVMHVRAASFDQLVGWQRTWPWLKSSLYYATKHLPGWQVGLLWLLTPLTILLTIPAAAKHLMLRNRNRVRL